MRFLAAAASSGISRLCSGRYCPLARSMASFTLPPPARFQAVKATFAFAAGVACGNHVADQRQVAVRVMKGIAGGQRLLETGVDVPASGRDPPDR